MGRNGKWDESCLKYGTLRLGYYEASHDAALVGDAESLRKTYLKPGKSTGTATNHARQVLAFYDPAPDTVWITFSKGFMWWCNAKGPVEFLGHDKIQNPYGSRLRRTTKGWSNRSMTGQELRMSDLSGRLTSVANFRGTICKIKDADLEYLHAKISGEDVASVKGARQAATTLKEELKKLITTLTWQDFEVFVDILFAKSGWVRVSQAGKTMKDIDMELIQPVTGERALVQVKSKTDQIELDAYAENLQGYAADKLFYIYHTPEHALQNKHANLTLMNLDKLADAALRTGLIHWLIEKA